MDFIRKSVVAGSFYTGNAIELENEILLYLANVKLEKSFSDILGVISPHAGYFYSAKCASYSYKALSQKNFKTVIVIAPSHHYNNFAFSIGFFDAYQTPLGNITVNKNISEQLLTNKEFVFFEQAHLYEHSLEVQLPFLQTINQNFDLVPIVFGAQTLDNAYILANYLYPYYKDNPKDIAFVISSDLSHYYNHKIAKQKDTLFMNLLKAGNPENLWQSYLKNEVEACGIGGIMTLMILAKMLNYRNISTLKYSNSGEANNDFSQVVGYLSAIIYNN